MKRYFFISLALFFLAFPAHADITNDQHVFNIDPQYDSRGRSTTTVTLRVISDRAYLYVADEYWNQLGQTGQTRLLSQMTSLGNEFDQRIYSQETAFFGSEPNPGIDGDPRVTLVLANLRTNVGGYFDSSNEYSRAEVPASNEREMIFINTNFLSDAPRLYPFLAHEFQHLISFNQKEKIRGITDDIWLNELRSEYAIQYLGYNTPFQGSNLERRAQAFLSQPSDSSTEWKNNLADYGQIALLGTYIGEHWSPRIIADQLTSTKTNIASINDALTRNGFTDTFQDMFTNWMITNALNNSTLGAKFSYTNSGLANVRVNPTSVISNMTDTAVLDVQLILKDWEQHWYDIQGFMPGSNPTLQVSFSGDLASLRVPYVVFPSSGPPTVRTAIIDATHPNLLIPGIGASVARVLLMPYTSQKSSNFSSNEPAHAITMHLARVAQTVVPTPTSVTPEQFDLHEGDFIRAEGDNDIHIINQNGYKRIVLSPEICLQYGHLGARGCFSAVRMVTPAIRDAFTTSPYYTNGETNDGGVYQLIITGEDSAYLKDLHTMLYAFGQDDFDARAVFRINNREQASYQ